MYDFVNFCIDAGKKESSDNAIQMNLAGFDKLVMSNTSAIIGLQRRDRCLRRPLRRGPTGPRLHYGASLPRDGDGVRWVANKGFEISKFEFKCWRARTCEVVRARSRLYRSQILQVNTRRKALDEIYMFPLHHSGFL